MRGTMLQRQGRIGFYGEVRGQEASVVGCGSALDKDDWVFPALREGLIMLMRGYPLDRFVAAMASDDVQAVLAETARFNWHRSAIVALLRQPGIKSILLRSLFR